MTLLRSDKVDQKKKCKPELHLHMPLLGEYLAETRMGLNIYRNKLFLAASPSSLFDELHMPEDERASLNKFPIEIRVCDCESVDAV